MPKLLKEQFVKESICNWLRHHKYGRNLKKGELREKGVDIKSMNNDYQRYFLVETKGESKKSSGNENNFVYALGQIITRIDTKAKYKYGIGLPAKSAAIALRRIPWQIAKKLWLHIFSVDKNGKVDFYDWKRIKEFQKMKKLEA